MRLSPAIIYQHPITPLEQAHYQVFHLAQIENIWQGLEHKLYAFFSYGMVQICDEACDS